MTGALSIARLQNVKAIFFDGELEVLHVFEMVLEKFTDLHQRFVRGGHFLDQMGDGMGRAHAGDDVFALCVDQIFAVENFFAAGRITCKRNAGSTAFAHVPKHHRLHVHGRAPIVRDSVFAPIDNRAVVHPRTEHRADRSPHLLLRILWKRFAGALLDQRFESLHKLL